MLMPLRTKILCTLTLTLVLFSLFNRYRQPYPKNNQIFDLIETNNKIESFQYNPKHFDKALFINGPKYSQFEDEEDRLRSYKAVKKQASELFYRIPAADKKDDTDIHSPEFYLRPGLVPPEVFYLWCNSGEHNNKQSNWFEYNNYLAVSSALEALHPDKLFIFYEAYPERDRTIYHQWLSSLKKDFSGLYLYAMNPQEATNYCQSTSRESKLDVIFSLLDVFGGLYIGESTWLLNFSPENRGYDLDFAYDMDSSGLGDGYIMMKSGVYSKFIKEMEGKSEVNGMAEEFVRVNYEKYNEGRNGGKKRKEKKKEEEEEDEDDDGDGDVKFDRNKNGDEIDNINKMEDDNSDEDRITKMKNVNNNKNNNNNKNIVFSSCYNVQHLYHEEKIKENAKCIIVKGDSFNRFYPMDIWQLDDPFGRLTRKIFYGSERIRLPVPDYKNLVPNIGHMIWLGGRDMDYVFYLSLLSLLFVAKVERVYVHGDFEPGGPHWRDLKTLPQTRQRINFITRTNPYYIYQEAVEPYYYSLMSDLIRVDLMIKYGGIYTDTDAIWVRPLSFAERGYEAVASYDWIDWSWPYQDTVNFGVSYGKRDAPFWRVFRDSMRKLYNEVRGFTGVMMPYKLLEKYPEMLRIDRRLSVICYHSKCHPTYFHDYHNEKKDHTNTNSIPNWRHDVHAFHWTHPNPREYFNKTVLLQSNGVFAELGRNVLVSAGLL